MIKAPVSRRYARALLQIGTERGNFDVLREQLSALAEAYASSREFRNIMNNPSVKIEERRAILTTIADKKGFDPIMRNFVLLLLDKDRFRFIQHIASEYERLADVSAGRVRAKISSAAELSNTQRLMLRKQIEKLTGANSVEIEAEIDPTSLLGGVVTRVGGMVLDGSVRTQLESMRASILNEL